MDLEASTHANFKTKNARKQSLSRRNTNLILMPWEKRHQHTLTNFLKGSHSPKNNVQPDRNSVDTCSEKKSISKDANGELGLGSVSQSNLPNKRLSHFNVSRPSQTEKGRSLCSKGACSLDCDNALKDERGVKIKRSFPNVMSESSLLECHLPKVCPCGSREPQDCCNTTQLEDNYKAAFGDLPRCAATSNRDKIGGHDLIVDTISHHGVKDGCAITSYGEVNAVLDKAFKRSGKHNLNGLFEYDGCKDTSRLRQVLDISSS